MSSKFPIGVLTINRVPEGIVFIFSSRLKLKEKHQTKPPRFLSQKPFQTEEENDETENQWKIPYIYIRYFSDVALSTSDIWFTNCPASSMG